MDFNNILDLSDFSKKEVKKEKEVDKEKEKEINFEKEIEIDPSIINLYNQDIFENRKDIKSAHGKRIKPGMIIDPNKETKDITFNNSKNIATVHLDTQTYILDDTEKTIHLENSSGLIFKTN